MTPKEQQARRRELHALPTTKLINLYAAKSGHLVGEVRDMVRGLNDEGRGILIDGIVNREKGR